MGKTEVFSHRLEIRKVYKNIEEYVVKIEIWPQICLRHGPYTVRVPHMYYNVTLL